MRTLAIFLALAISALGQSVTISAPVFSGAGLNDATSGGAFSLLPTNASYVVAISATGTPDHFTWTKDGGAASSAVAITGALQTLADGVKIRFAATAGHTLADSWTISATAKGSAAGVNTIQSGPGAITRTAEDKIREIVSVTDYGAVGDCVADDTAAVLKALRFAPSGATVKFPGIQRLNGLRACYRVGQLGTITKRYTIDGDGSVIEPDADGAIWATFGAPDENDITVLRRISFKPYLSTVPVTVLRLEGGINNVQLETVNWTSLTCSFACLDAYNTYGIRITGGAARYNTAPYLFYFRHNPGGATATYDASISRFDFSHTTGADIGTEGGELSYDTGVIESASDGGIQHVLNPSGSTSCSTGHDCDSWSLRLHLKDIHFEALGGFGAYKGAPLIFGTNSNTYEAVEMVNVSDETVTSEQFIYLGGWTDLIVDNAFISSACIAGDSAHTIFGKISVRNYRTFGAPASCSVDRKGYLLKTAIANMVNVSYPDDFTSFGPIESQTLSGGAGAAIHNFRDNTGTVKAHFTVEGDVVNRDSLPRDMLATRNFGAKDVINSHQWFCRAEFHSTASDLDCFFDTVLKMAWDNDGSYQQLNLAGTGVAPVLVNSAGKLSRDTAGLSVTKTIRNAAGTGTCTLIYAGGLLTGGTC